jgi:hypothetical protein
MHASIQHYAGDPDVLLAAYDALIADVPIGGYWAQLCLRADDGIIVVDTCPTKEIFDAFVSGEAFRAALAGHGLPAPTVQDFPVHAGILHGRLERAS